MIYPRLVDAMAREIRRIDGSHTLGAAQLAEALTRWMTERFLFPAGWILEQELMEKGNDEVSDSAGT